MIEERREEFDGEDGFHAYVECVGVRAVENVEDTSDDGGRDLGKGRGVAVEPPDGGDRRGTCEVGGVGTLGGLGCLRATCNAVRLDCLVRSDEVRHPLAVSGAPARVLVPLPELAPRLLGIALADEILDTLGEGWYVPRGAI